MQADKKTKKVAKKGFPSTMPASGPSSSSSSSLSSSQSIPSSFQHASGDKKHQTAPMSARTLRSESVSSSLPSLNMASLASSSSSSSVNTLGSSRKDTHRENTKKTPVSSPREAYRPIFVPLILDRRSSSSSTSSSSSSAAPLVQPEILVLFPISFLLSIHLD